jgi:hypothetical protein
VRPIDAAKPTKPGSDPGDGGLNIQVFLGVVLSFLVDVGESRSQGEVWLGAPIAGNQVSSHHTDQLLTLMGPSFSNDSFHLSQVLENVSHHLEDTPGILWQLRDEPHRSRPNSTKAPDILVTRLTSSSMTSHPLSNDG